MQRVSGQRFVAAIAGNLPIENLMRLYDYSRINEAVADQLSGRCAEPLLTWQAITG